MSERFTGGCACGAVRYRAEGPTEFSFHCCCRKCQRATGGGHSSAFAIPRERVEVVGEIQYYAQEADTGATTRSGFCAVCGSPIVSKTDRFPERWYIHAATLDDPSAFEPSFVVYEEAAQPWDYLDPSLKSAG